MSDMIPSGAQPPKKLKIAWYRCPIEPATLRKLTKRSDAKGLMFVLGQLLLLGGTGYFAHYFFTQRIWIGLAIALWVHGTMRGLAGSGVHELSHGTVFRSKWLGAIVLRVWSLLYFFNFHHYKMSHTFHHLYTLHPEGDGEVMLPKHYSLDFISLFQLVTFDVVYLVRLIAANVSIAVAGRFRLFDQLVYGDAWTDRFLTPEETQPRKKMIGWTRIVLLFHFAAIVVSAWFGFWMIPVVLTLGPFIGRWYIFLIAATMHSGLRDNVPDFRLCTRTIKLDPLSGFLRWNMQYHIEHHMFAAVPCYNLGRLHREVVSDMPKRRTLAESWREIRETQRRQESDPDYQFDTPLPERPGNPSNQDPLAAEIGDLSPEHFGHPQSST